jgi:hypothetical protein
MTKAGKSLGQSIQDLEHERRELILQLNKLLDELEGQRAVRSRAAGRLPFVLIERSISWLVLAVERRVSGLVAMALSKAEERRHR